MMVSLKWPKGHKQNSREGPVGILRNAVETKPLVKSLTFGDVDEVGKHQGVLTYSHKFSVRIPRKHFQGLN